MADQPAFGAASILVSDQKTDQILLLQDIDGNGEASTSDEIKVFFDSTNQSALPSPTGNVFSLHQGANGAVFVGDGQSDAIYRLLDLNGDSDAQDPKEAQVWFSSKNAASLPLVTPNGLWQGFDGAVYIANAGTPVEPVDVVYRTVDMNGDGDADDADEAIEWLNLSETVTEIVPSAIGFAGDIAFVNDLAVGTSKPIYRMEDKDENGFISESEIVPFVSFDMVRSSSLNVASFTVNDGSVYALSWKPQLGNTVRLIRLNDKDGSGLIDQSGELTEVWSSLTLPTNIQAQIAYSVSIDGAGDVTLSANGFDGMGNVLRLRDLNRDQDYLDPGETMLFASSSFTHSLIKPRAVEFYEDVSPFVASTAPELLYEGVLAIALTALIQRVLG